MPGVLRSLAGRGVWAGAVGLALAGPAAADDGPELPAVDPIAASNRLDDPFHRPAVILLTAADAPWMVSPAGDPPPRPVAPPAPRPVAPSPAEPMQVTWAAARRQPAATPLPTSDRPMIPCEPVKPLPPPTVLTAPRMEPPPPVALAAPRMEPPPMPAPRPDPLRGCPAPAPVSPPPPPKVEPTMTAADEDDFHAHKPVTTCRFLDEPTPAKTSAEDAVVMAVLRRGGDAVGSAADIRAAVEKVCKPKAVECQTEVAGERQVRVLLTVRSVADWQRLFARLEDLPELGEYGLLFQVRVEKEGK